MEGEGYLLHRSENDLRMYVKKICIRMNYIKLPMLVKKDHILAISYDATNQIPVICVNTVSQKTPSI